MESQINSIIRSQTIQEFEFPHSNNMKTALIFAGAIALVLISMESPAFGSPTPGNEALDSLINFLGLGNDANEWPACPRVRCRSHSDCQYVTGNRRE